MKKLNVKQVLKNQSRAWTGLALGLLLLSSVGCSTPLVQDSSTTDQMNMSENWQAYQNCLNSLPPGTSGNVCNGVGTNTVSSQTTYVGGSSGPRGAYHEEHHLSVSEAQAAYKAYLATQEPAQLALMTQQWLAIAQQNQVEK
jgi:hypothetical protein